MANMYENAGNSTVIISVEDVAAGAKNIDIPAGAYFASVVSAVACKISIDPDGSTAFDNTGDGNAWPLGADEKLPGVEVHKFEGQGKIRIVADTGNLGFVSCLFTGRNLQ